MPQGCLRQLAQTGATQSNRILYALSTVSTISTRNAFCEFSSGVVATHYQMIVETFHETSLQKDLSLPSRFSAFNLKL
jgi:hypothetical protein